MNVYSHQFNADSRMPEGGKNLGEPVVMKWAKSDPLVGIGFTDLSKIGGANGTPAPLPPGPVTDSWHH